MADHRTLTAADVERAFAHAFELARELDRDEPAAVDRILTAYTAHVRSWKAPLLAEALP